MEIQMTGRAEIALRSVDPTERQRVLNVIKELRTLSPLQMIGSRNFQQLKTVSDEKLYTYRASPRLRIILSKTESAWMVEDIVDRERLDQILPKRGRS